MKQLSANIKLNQESLRETQQNPPPAPPPSSFTALDLKATFVCAELPWLLPTDCKPFRIISIPVCAQCCSRAAHFTINGPEQKHSLRFISGYRNLHLPGNSLKSNYGLQSSESTLRSSTAPVEGAGQSGFVKEPGEENYKNNNDDTAWSR